VDHLRTISQQRQRRQWRVRKRLRGTAERPRLSVFRSSQHIYAQMVDDAAGRTLVAASTRDADLRGQFKYGGNKAAAKLVGQALAQKAVAAGITLAAFDRREYKYHGRVAALADGAREGGLQF